MSAQLANRIEALTWREYDYCAEWCARRGIRGNVGDPLPDYVSGRVVKLINDDPEAFAERVRATAYAMAMERTGRKYGGGLA